MLTRRDLLKAGALGLLAQSSCRRAEEREAPPTGVVLNDVHSKLNATRVDKVVRPASVRELEGTLGEAARRGRPVSIAGGRHAMGGQQFGEGTLHIDMSALDRVLSLDAETGIINVEAGIEWPKLVHDSLQMQGGEATARWGIAQKQTGADRLSLGGALASNIHGRGLTLPPLVADVESFTLMDASGEIKTCSRTENPNLFRLAIGGYGLFGVVASVRLRLVPRRKVRRIVEVLSLGELADGVKSRVEDGFLFGDFQFMIDNASENFLKRGVFSCYKPVELTTPIPADQGRLGGENWLRLVDLVHSDKARAFEEFAAYYLSTSEQVYWSDTHQLSYYGDDYHSGLDRRSGARVPGSEMISEVYVPRSQLENFMDEVAERFRALETNVIYGTVRWIETDDETFLAWAREPWAAIVFNLHVDHSPAGIERAKAEFRALIDFARERGGTYYLTYHRWATREQVNHCYPRMAEFLKKKLEHDPEERFRSNWYRHHKAMVADRL